MCEEAFEKLCLAEGDCPFGYTPGPQCQNCRYFAIRCRVCGELLNSVTVKCHAQVCTGLSKKRRRGAYKTCLLLLYLALPLLALSWFFDYLVYSELHTGVNGAYIMEPVATFIIAFVCGYISKIFVLAIFLGMAIGIYTDYILNLSLFGGVNKLFFPFCIAILVATAAGCACGVAVRKKDERLRSKCPSESAPSSAPASSASP